MDQAGQTRMRQRMVSSLSDARAMEMQVPGGRIHARRETAEVCTEILREDEAMAGWLEQQLPALTRKFLRRQCAGQEAKR